MRVPETCPKLLEANFYEKALFVKPTCWRLLCGVNRLPCLPFKLRFYSL